MITTRSISIKPLRRLDNTFLIVLFLLFVKTKMFYKFVISLSFLCLSFVNCSFINFIHCSLNSCIYYNVFVWKLFSLSHFLFDFCFVALLMLFKSGFINVNKICFQFVQLIQDCAVCI